MAAAASAYRHWCRAAASSRASSLRHSLLFTGVHLHSYGAVESAVILPYVQIGRNVRLTKVIIDSEVVIPAGLVVGEDPELDAARFRRTAQGVCLITQPMIDRLRVVNKLHVLSVASEMYPLVKTGGLADVVGALPAALAREGIATHTLIPGYPEVIAALSRAETVHSFARLQNGRARLLKTQTGGADLLVLDAPHLYARPGNPYVGPDGHEWPDNALRFAALGAVRGPIAREGIAGFTPDVIHAHDWQAGLAPALLHYGGGRARGQ